MKIQLKKDSNFKAWFKSQSKLFRIEAVIHDGQWYDIDKWASVSYTTREDIEEYIREQNNKSVLIERNGSYRVNIDCILQWYKEHNLDINQPLVPNNFIPKLWGGKTETQQFIDTPKRLVNTLTIDCLDFPTKEFIKGKLKGYCKVVDYESKPTLKVYTLSTDFIEEYLKQTLDKNTLEKINLRKRTNVLWRDLSDFDEVFLQELLSFYSNYAKGLLKPHTKTMEIFLPGVYDRETQIQEWILRAADKFDETNNVPFSGYLASVLQRWPYDLPNNELGIELAKFQRERHKALSYLIEDTGNEYLNEEDIRRLTPYSPEEYYKLLDEHTLWTYVKTASTLNWDKKNEEKAGHSIFSHQDGGDNEAHQDKDDKFSYDFTLSLFKAANKTGDYISLSNILDNYTEDIKNIEVGNDFKEELWELLNDDK